jgi:hypothetical protein
MSIVTGLIYISTNSVQGSFFLIFFSGFVIFFLMIAILTGVTWVCVLISGKPKHSWPRDKRMEKDLLSITGKESMGVVSTELPPFNKGSVEILLREPVHFNREKHFRNGHIPEHTQLNSTFQSRLGSWSWSTCSDS